MNVWCSISQEINCWGDIIQRIWIGNNSLAAIDPVLLKLLMPILCTNNVMYSEHVTDWIRIHKNSIWMEI